MTFTKNNPFLDDTHLLKTKRNRSGDTSIKSIAFYILLKICYLILFLCLLIPQSIAMTLISPIQEGSLIFGVLQPGENLFLGNTKIRTNPQGQFFFGLPQDAVSPLKLKLITAEKEQILTYPIIKRKWDEEIINGLPPQKVTLSPLNQKRIQQENLMIKKARSNWETTFFPTCFNRPVKNYKRISSHFGSRRILNGIKKAGHSGTDYAAPIGTPVYAPADGIVAFVHSDMFLTGKTILINHGYGLFSSYSHLNAITVKEGEYIQRGDLIGEIGTTGRSTGPHLHYVITWLSTRIDPEQLIKDYPCP